MSSTSSSACEWCTIESDPGVMTELLEELGVVGVELQELCSLDDESLASCGTVLGFLFLFQWLPTTSTTTSTSSTSTSTTTATIPEGLFFAHQTVTNACATQALLSIVMNSPTIDKGQRLTDFQTFTASFPPTLLGDAIGATTQRAPHPRSNMDQPTPGAATRHPPPLSNRCLTIPDTFRAEQWCHTPVGE